MQEDRWAGTVPALPPPTQVRGLRSRAGVSYRYSTSLIRTLIGRYDVRARSTRARKNLYPFVITCLERAWKQELADLSVLPGFGRELTAYLPAVAPFQRRRFHGVSYSGQLCACGAAGVFSGVVESRRRPMMLKSACVTSTAMTIPVARLRTATSCDWTRSTHTPAMNTIANGNITIRKENPAA